MTETFINLPLPIAKALSTLLSGSEKQWMSDAQALHMRYMNRLPENEAYLSSPEDSLAYLGLRTPATYAQISSALQQVKEALPSFEPKSLLDLGSGPGVGAWAASKVWPTLTNATCIDTDSEMIKLGEHINKDCGAPLTITWIHKDVRVLKSLPQTDLIIIANTLNEMSSAERASLISSLETLSNPIIVILEPGNTNGVKIIQDVSERVNKTHTLIAPYINRSYVSSSSYWIHFSQRFLRPEFSRLLRQSMRENENMASDWEAAKYTYTAFAKNVHPVNTWARCIGQVKKQKGFLDVPVLTQEEVCTLKVLKRYKKEYAFAKELRWGDVITKKESLIHSTDL